MIFTLPALAETEGSFTFELADLQSSGNIVLGEPRVFEYEVLANDAAGEWELEISSAEEFEAFKEVFGPLQAGLNELSFEDITGKVAAEFGFDEMKFVVELAEEEGVTTCEDGDTETEIVNKEIEIEAEYEVEDGEIVLEGSHFIVGDDGEIENELDFIVDGTYTLNEVDGTISINFLKVVDEDNFKDGEELFKSSEGLSFIFVKN